MSNVSMKAMLEAGVHFGHQTSRWNPKMGRYIFGERNGVHILDLQKTAKELKKACAFVKEESKKGAKFLFVGTKKQARGYRNLNLPPQFFDPGVPYYRSKPY